MTSQPQPDYDCPLPASTQTRNVLIFATNWALIYLASPVAYVGVVQATVLKDLQFSDTQANLPASVYLWSTPLAVLLLCRFPQVRMLKPLMVSAFSATALLGAVVAFAALSRDSDLVFASLIAFAAVWGCGNGLIASCQWEMVARGASESRRGTALGLAFGVGPMFAVMASLAAQNVMGGEQRVIAISFIPALDSPQNLAILYGASVPIMLVAAILSSLYVAPTPAVEPPRQPWMASVFGGIGEFVRYRILLIATIAYVLVYSGHEILQNLSLYAEVAIGEPPSRYAGYQMMLRFGVKILAGFALAWLLVRSNPRRLLVVTAALTLTSVLWAILVPGEAYLFAFGILGAGELFGVYYLNYIVGCSAPGQMRRNVGFASMATLLVGFAPVMYGRISDSFADKALGFQMSFAVSIAIEVMTILIVVTLLPAQPRPLEVVQPRDIT